MRARISILLAMILVGLLSFTSSVFAEGNIPFEIKPKFTADQQEGVANYISIKVDGDSKEDIFEFSLKNRASESKEVSISVVDAYTSPNGVIQYTNIKSENSTIVDENYKMSNHLTLEGENVITLKGGEERVIRTHLNAKSLEGVLLGGVSFQLYEEGGSTGDEESSFKINNKINMVVGVVVEFDSDKDVNIVLDKPFVDPMPSYYAIRLPITMDAPLFKKVSMNYEVLKDGELLFNGTTNYEFAPKTKANVSIPWEAESIKSNENYQLRGTLEYTNKDGEIQEQPFDFKFDYSPNDNTVGNITNALTRPFEDESLPWTLGIVAGVAVALLAFFLLRRKETYILFHNEDFPAEIHKGNPLYEKMIVETNEYGKEYGVYNKKKGRNGEHFFVYSHREIRKTDKVYKLNK